MGPVTLAFNQEFPAATVRTTLDDSLVLDMPDGDSPPSSLERRMISIIEVVLAGAPDGVLVACSSYADVVARFRDERGLSTPIMKADEGLYHDVAASGYAKVGIVVALPAAVAPAIDGLQAAYTALSRRPPQIEVCCVAEAPELADDPERFRAFRAFAEAGKELREWGADAIVLGQYSLTEMAESIAAAANCPVLTGPVSAARAMRARLLDEPAAVSGAPTLPATTQ
jgi:Asp/Glu/hydantoin racemase